jgi:Peptidase family M28
MKLAKAELQPGDETSRLATPLEELGGRYAKFGTSFLVFADEAEYDGLAERAGEEGLPLEDIGSVDDRENLYVVRQMGAVFQKEHADVPVFYDKGRYLLVEMSPEQADELSARDEAGFSPDFSIEPLKDNETIFDVRVPGADRVAREPWVQELVNAVSDSEFETNLKHLVDSHPTRHSPSEHFDEVVEEARSQLDAMGYTTTVQPFTFGGSETSQNLIADKTGRGTGTRQIVIVCAHMDSINIQGGPGGFAPGADDNGSGFIGLLEMARVFMDHAAVHDLRFVGTGAEERGLFGSREYVDKLPPAERQRIKCVVNMDMIATVNTPSRTVLLEGAPVSRGVIDELAIAAATYTSLEVQTSEQAANSDHVPFIRGNIPAVLTIEGTDQANHHVHTGNDTLTFIDSSLAKAILQMNVAAVATALEKEGDTAMPEDATSLAELLSATGSQELQRRQLSGQYLYNGEVFARQAANSAEGNAEARYATTTDPIFTPVEDAILLPGPVDDSGANLDGGQREALGFRLHLDIDGSYPLNVVSGTVLQDLSSSAGGSELAHFIGRVTSDTVAGGTRKLIVEDFSFRWPGTDGNEGLIDSLQIDLPTSFPLAPSIEVSFIATDSNYSHGPYIVHQESTYFHTVEVEVDQEDNAVEVEPYNTLTHPVRPADLPEEELTLESTFAKAGIRITRTPSGTVIDTGDAGTNNRWSNQELHDAMEAHWSAFADRPQWKLWVFLAELHENNGLGGIMFDANLPAPGGVDRQGTAIFTKNGYFHSVGGTYVKANPPEAEAVKRELFFNLVHETAHSFNLFHAFQKTANTPWPSPPWMPIRSNAQALTWMNYPDAATPYPAGASAKWFYNQFRFRFDDAEHLFLRHAPEEFIEMGNSAWGQAHGRVAQADLDDRLKLEVSGIKQVFEWGEPVFVKLTLQNKTDQELLAQTSLNPGEGSFVEVAITNPQGHRVPFLPAIQTRSEVRFASLRPDEVISEIVNLTVGQLGFPFTRPGMYRIEASYTNSPGGSAAAVANVYVQEPNGENALAAKDLFDARVGRALLVDGTRTMEDVNQKMKRVEDQLGDEHPTTLKLRLARGLPFTGHFKVLGADTSRVRLEDPNEQVIDETLARITANQDDNAEKMGYELYSRAVFGQTAFLVTDGRSDEARALATRTADFFVDRQAQGRVAADAVAAMTQFKESLEQ